ncbi:MAG: hypothetical protein ACFUZC_10045 [Chthoniobacteraceae bacterium]
MQTTLTTAAKATRRSNKEQARDAFLLRIGSARELVAMLARHLDDHMGVALDEVNWANVGDAAHLVEVLKHAARGCNLIAEE